MDQNTIIELVTPDPAEPGVGWKPGDAWLAGGTFLLSLPLPQLRRFRDLSQLGWTAIQVVETGLEIGATCKVRELLEFTPPADWDAGPLLQECVNSFLAGFKVWNTATVGGNICTSIPAGPMTTMACALEAEYTLIRPDNSTRVIPAIDFVTGNNQNILSDGELLRSIRISEKALHRRYATRRFTLTKAGRSSIFLVATTDSRNSEFLLTVSAATIHPVQLRFDAVPEAAELSAALDEQIPFELYFDDPNGRPDHRKHLTYIFAQELRAELSE